MPKGRRVLVSYTAAEALLLVRAGNFRLTGEGTPLTGSEKATLRRAVERTVHRMGIVEERHGEFPQPGMRGKDAKRP